MAEEKNLKQAKRVYDTLCGMLEDGNWRFERNDEKMFISMGVRGDDLPIPFNIEVDADRDLILLMSQLPFIVPEEKRIETAIAISAINFAMVDGNFDYNISNGALIFRMTSSFRESLIGKELFEYMLVVGCRTIDDYNDKLKDFIDGKISLGDVINYVKA